VNVRDTFVMLEMMNVVIIQSIAVEVILYAGIALWLAYLPYGGRRGAL
jgi:hypothetical protein